MSVYPTALAVTPRLIAVGEPRTARARHLPCRPVEEGRTRERLRLAAAVVVLVLLVAFAVDNSHSVQVGFLFTERDAPLIWILIVTAVLGAVADRLIRWRRG